MPLIILAPLAAFVMAVSSVRTRRASANLAMLGALVALGATLLVGWGLSGKATTYIVTYVYLSTNVAFSGPAPFQNFEIDIAFHVDHLTLAALAVIELSVLLVLAWNRTMGRNEPGAVRMNAIVSVFLFGCVGTLVSSDLAEMFTFWALAGGATYLLLAHRWGDEQAARSGRIALALPFLTDLFLLCGIAELYSRYGRQSLATLIPVLHSSPGWNVRQLVIASILLFVGVAGRLALWPLHSWITATATTAPPAASALMQAVWPVMAITVLYRLLPIIGASNAQTMKAFVIACGVSAVIAPLVSLLGREPRQVLALAGVGVTAVGTAIVIHGFQFPAFTFAAAGVACVFAAAPARAAGLLASSAVVGAMRTEDMAEMGDAWRRMRATAGVLLAVAFALGLSAAGALAIGVDSRSRFGLVLGEAVFLVSVGALRVFMAVGTGPLMRRRAFDPDRVRDVPSAARAWPYWLVVASLALAAASLVTGLLKFLDGATHQPAKPAAYGLWLAVALAGLAAAAFSHARSRAGALRASRWLGDAAMSRLTGAAMALNRFVLTPLARLVDRTGEWLPAGDGALGGATLLTGRMAVSAARAPAVPELIVMAVLLALLIGLLSPGVLR